jgi:hypothetical protein
MTTGRNVALIVYAAAMSAIAVGVSVAMARYPGGFDWAYTVISRLASSEHNPGGGLWLSGGLLVVVPLLAIGISQVALYFDQRDLGWVNTGWREMGIPLWLSFAFWQWLAVTVLGVGVGHLIATSGPGRRRVEDSFAARNLAATPAPTCRGFSSAPAPARTPRSGRS